MPPPPPPSILYRVTHLTEESLAEPNAAYTGTKVIKFSEN
jgi:hypothetical protein